MNTNERLKQRLIAYGMNLHLLSKKSGVAYATVYNIFTGKKAVEDARVDSLKRLADALMMSMDELYQELSAETRTKELAPIRDFALMWKDELIAEVEIHGCEVYVTRYDKNPAKQIFPEDRISLFVLGEILRFRCWDEHRPDMEKLLHMMELDAYNPYEIVKRTHGLMAQDPIWLRFEGEQLTYKEVRRLRFDTGCYA